MDLRTGSITARFRHAKCRHHFHASTGHQNGSRAVSDQGAERRTWLADTRKRDKMKIAQIAPLYEAVPPLLYGGTERIVAYLCDALVEMGHDVTLFASAEAKTRAKLVSMRDQAIR